MPSSHHIVKQFLGYDRIMKGIPSNSKTPRKGWRYKGTKLKLPSAVVRWQPRLTEIVTINVTTQQRAVQQTQRHGRNSHEKIVKVRKMSGPNARPPDRPTTRRQFNPQLCMCGSSVAMSQTWTGTPVDSL